MLGKFNQHCFNKLELPVMRGGGSPVSWIVRGEPDGSSAKFPQKLFFNFDFHKNQKSINKLIRQDSKE